MSVTIQDDPQWDGWNYHCKPAAGDARKLVCLREGSMEWIGIRAWNHTGLYWMNNNEPEKAEVFAWRDLPDLARGYWSHGIFFMPTTEDHRP